MVCLLSLIIPYIATNSYINIIKFDKKIRPHGPFSVLGCQTTGKDADFLVFDDDLLTAEHEGFSYNTPKEAYFGGKKVK